MGGASMDRSLHYVEGGLVCGKSWGRGTWAPIIEYRWENPVQNFRMVAL